MKTLSEVLSLALIGFTVCVGLILAGFVVTPTVLVYTLFIVSAVATVVIFKSMFRYKIEK
ncbi:MAG: hypothetical protein RR922_05700 [Clostridia bacterium]